MNTTTRIRRFAAAVLSCGLLTVAAGCAGTDAAPELPSDVAQQPMPVGAQDPAQLPEATEPDTSCGDPRASLRPESSSLEVPEGSTMEKIKLNGKLVVGVDQNTYLFGYRDPVNNQLDGFDVDIAREISRAIFGTPNKVQFKAITSDQRIPFVTSGQVDMVVRTMTMNCARWKEVSFSSEYFTAHQRILYEKDHTPVDSFEDLPGEKICAATGSTSILNIANAEVEPKPIPVSAPEWSDCLVMLQQGTVDAISTDNTILAGFAQQDPQLRISETDLSEEPYGIAISQENDDLVRYVNAVLEKIRGDGTWQEIYQANQLDGEDVLGPASPPQAIYRD